MTIFARSRSWLAGALSRPTLSARVAVPFAALLVMLLVAAPANAVVTTVGETTVGLQPRSEQLGEGEASKFGNPEGNAVVHGASVFVDYWDPGDHFKPEWLFRMNTFFQRLESDSLLLSNILSNQAQYRDRTNTGAKYQDVFKGGYSDTEKYPTEHNCTDPHPLVKGAVTCITDAQVRAHLQSYITLHSLPRGMNSIFYVILPPGVTVCLDEASTHCSDFEVEKLEEEENVRESESWENSFCSYHGAINPDPAPQGDGNTVLYAALPWSAGTLTASGLSPKKGFYTQAYDCQDGGWNPEKHLERRESPKEVSKQEEKEFEEATKEKQQEILEKRAGEGPHQEEPSSEEQGESGGWALADLMENQIAVEQANLITDPLLKSWKDTTGHESTDLCRNVFGSTFGVEGKPGPELGGSVSLNEKTLAGTLSNAVIGYNDSELGSGNYYINNVFDNAGDGCVAGVSMVPRFTSPNPVNNNEPVAFDGMESSVSLIQTPAFNASGPNGMAFSTFVWNFGDGTETTGFAPGAPLCESPWVSPCAGSTFHTYAYGGTYHVTLTITDVGGYTARVEHQVVVNGPPPPAPVGGSSGPPGSGNVGGHSGGTEGSGSGAGLPTPVASVSIASRSLRNVVRKGLVVRYSVNEQVAGRTEVLISKSLAKRLKLSGAPAATGLPAGSPAEVVIGKAVLVTTKAGKGTLTIQLSKSVAARLKKAHSAGLMVRLVVRNAASKSGAQASVMSSATVR